MPAISRRSDRAAGERQFALHEIDRLDAVGAFVDRGDARIAHVLRRAGLLDVAHAAVDLHAERSDLVADVGRERLGDRRQQRGALARRRALLGARRVKRAVDRHRRQVADAARRLDQRLHRHQHALDIRMLDDRAHAGAAAGAAPLPALARVGEGALIQRLLADRHALHADGEPRAVHHHEHRRQAAVLLADQPALRPARVAVDHDAGRRSVDSELVLDAGAAHVVAGARANRRLRRGISARGTATGRAFRAARRAGARARDGRCCRPCRVRRR